MVMRLVPCCLTGDIEEAAAYYQKMLRRMLPAARNKKERDIYRMSRADKHRESNGNEQAPKKRLIRRESKK